MALALVLAALLGCQAPPSPRPVGLLRLAQQLAQATRLEVDRDRLAPRLVLAQPTQAHWQLSSGAVAPSPGDGTLQVRAPGAFTATAELDVTPDVEYVLTATGHDLTLSVACEDAAGHRLWQTPSMNRRGDKTEWLHGVIARGSKLAVRIEGATAGTLATLTVREAMRQAHAQILAAEAVYLRAAVSRRVDAQTRRSLDAIAATGTSAYEWRVPPGMHRLEFATTAIPRHLGGQVEAAVHLRVEALQAGSWRPVFQREVGAADLPAAATAWTPARVDIGQASAVRLATAPLDPQHPHTLTVAWGTPTLRALLPRTQPDVAILTFDALRADHVGISPAHPVSLTPGLDALARHGARFLDARAAHTETWGALTGLAAGDWPENVGVPDRGRYLERGTRTVVDAFADAGYRTVRAGSYQMPFGQFGNLDTEDEIDHDAAINPDVLAMLTEPDRPPLLILAHFSATHYPYKPEPAFLPQGLTPQDDAGFADLARHPSERGHRDALRLYEACVRQTDQKVAQLLAALQTPGRAAGPALVAVLADHGSHHGERGVWFMHSTTDDAVLHVPLLLAGPGIPVARIGPLVRAIDVGPTLLDYAGLDPGGFAGRTLRPLLEGRPDVPRINTIHFRKPDVVKVETDRYFLAASPGAYRVHWYEFGPEVGADFPQFEFVARAPTRAQAPLRASAAVVGELYRAALTTKATQGGSLSPEARRLIKQAGYGGSE